MIKLYFSDFFNVAPEIIEKYGAFNISLIRDLPLFIDPFLLFNSKNKEYKKLHSDIIKYVQFLKNVSNKEGINDGLLRSWFMFPEVKQSWFGYSKTGNSGKGLGEKFAQSLNINLDTIFNNFGSENITNSSHLEKLCLIRDGVGRDNISDFTTNLIKGFLLKYTETFAKKYIDPIFIKEHFVRHVSFNYKTRSWECHKFALPTVNGDFVLLTPKDILTKDEIWINRNDMITDFSSIVNSIPNPQLRAEINQYFHKSLPKKANNKERCVAKERTISEFPEYIDYYIKQKEESSVKAQYVSNLKVKEIEELYNKQLRIFVDKIKQNSNFYNSTEEAYQRAMYLKQVIENNDGYRIFYLKNNQPIKREKDLQLLFLLTWFGTNCDVNSEVNNGRGPVDYKISNGAKDKVLVEFKLASNSQLKKNLQYQVSTYEAANQTKESITVILYFSDSEEKKLRKIFKELTIKENDSLIIIDARRTNKQSGSVVNSKSKSL